uniref:Mannose-6-phosphate isomerase, cupin superfamily n=1 Tax=Candidatus Kentrum sp. LPFa TaxID=2126335 RepID=A0A450W725_9GAMM|nr:MAG: Mannose-6-phosphate isomerase, cupin superfamily [Candidatus Kentron sp. LPFa]
MSKITNIQDIEQVRGHCGVIRRMTTDEPARFIHLLVNDAERHYHKKTTEYYYVLHGEGSIYLDGEIHAIEKGDLVTIPPGTVHNAIERDGPLEVMVVEVPPAIDDVFKVEK